MTQDQAAARQAARENLLAEVLSALNETTLLLQSACLVIEDAEARNIAIDTVRRAHFVIGKASVMLAPREKQS